MQIIYHGSYCKVEEPKIIDGKYTKDFGMGFYCTILEEQAIKWARKYDTPVINKIYKLAEVYHSENIEKVSDEIIKKYEIEHGNYDIISDAQYRVPTFWEIGRVYQRLIKMANSNEQEYISTAIQVLESWIIEKIDNYNSSMFYETPEYIYECYKEGKVL